MQSPGKKNLRYGLLSLTLGASACMLLAQEQKRTRPRPEDTEVWKPEPPVVTPAAENNAPPPSDAVVLFDGKSIDQWVKAGSQEPATWEVVGDGSMKVDKKGGNIETKRRFKDYQLHVEYRIPEDIQGSSQGRGNSGVFLASTGGGDAGYELQVLDNYNNKTYTNGMAGSMYKQAIPLANACRKPGEWQSYDVIWNAPHFKPDGSLQTPAYVTVIFNGVLVENHFELKGETFYIGKPNYHHVFDGAPIKLQAHGDASSPISFRNIWARDIPDTASIPFEYPERGENGKKAE